MTKTPSVRRRLLAALQLARSYVAKLANPQLNPDLAQIDAAIRAGKKSLTANP